MKMGTMTKQQNKINITKKQTNKRITIKLNKKHINAYIKIKITTIKNK